MYRGDLCDLSLLHFLFAKFNFTDVVHMAAQAGVRHSLADPLPYVHSNVECFLALLETLREHRVRVDSKPLCWFPIKNTVQIGGCITPTNG